MMVKADKITNYYAMSPQHYADLTHKNITKTYKKSTQSEINDINNEARLIADGINLSNPVEKLAEKDVFITLKDHKFSFKNIPTCLPRPQALGNRTRIIYYVYMTYCVAA